MKKILSMFLIIVMMAVSFTVTAFADKVENTEKMIEFFINAGILQGDGNGNYFLDENVTRTQFVTLILRVLGVEEVAAQFSGESTFYDVPQEFWGHGYIETAVGLGYINGYGDGTFRPDNSVSSYEAIKVLIHVLGYSHAAENNGGYPTGYQNIAFDLGVFKGGIVSVNNETHLTRLQVLSLIYYSLDIDMLDMYGNVREGETILSQYLKIEEYTGKVTATYDYSRAGGIGEGYVEISGKLYEIYSGMQTDVNEFFGCDVKCFFRRTDSGDYILVNMRESGKCDEIKIMHSDILPSTTLLRLVYADGRKTQTEQISENADIYYNGRQVLSPNLNDNLFKIESGHIVAKDTDNNGNYDVVLITEYQNIVVKNVSDDTIYDKYGNNLEIDIYDSNLNFQVKRDGKAAGYDNIAAGDVASAAVSFDNEVVRVYLANDTINGYLSAYSADDNEYTVEGVDGEEYLLKISSSYNYALAQNHYLSTKPELGNGYVFILDCDGFIADLQMGEFENKVDKLAWAYLVECGLKNGIGNTLQVKILTEKNQFEVFDFEKKVKFGRMVSGQYKVDSQDGETIRSRIMSGGKTQRQLVQYKLNEEGLISEFYIAADKTVKTDYFSKDVSSASLTYRENVIDQQYYVDSSTVFFAVPKSGEYEELMSAGKYYDYVKNGSTLYLDLYNVADGSPDVVVIATPTATLYEDKEDGYETVIDFVNSPIIFINEVYSARGNDGEYYTVVEGIQNGKTVSVYVSDELCENSEDRSILRKGMAVQYETNSEQLKRAINFEEIEKMILVKAVHDFNNPVSQEGMLWEYTTIVNTNPMISTLWGTTKMVTDSLCVVNADGVDYTVSLHGGTSVMEYSDEDGFVIKTIDDINDGDNVFIRQRYLNTREVVVY